MAGLPSSSPSALRTTRTRHIHGTAATISGDAVLVVTSRHTADREGVRVIVGHAERAGLRVFLELDAHAARGLAGLLNDAARRAGGAA